jgi:hypothetical protein
MNLLVEKQHDYRRDHKCADGRYLLALFRVSDTDAK